jgi:aspartyl/asparaginyl beta-hydroxylase (cupin superfamily)
MYWRRYVSETQYWEDGKGMVADTSFIHSTYNDSTDQDRYAHLSITRRSHPSFKIRFDRSRCADNDD